MWWEQHLVQSQHTINISCCYHYLLCYKFLLTLVAFTFLHIPPKFICGPDSSEHKPVFLIPRPMSLFGCPTDISNSQSQNWTCYLSPQTCVTSYIPSLSLCHPYSSGYQAKTLEVIPNASLYTLLCLPWHLLACLYLSIFTWTYERCSKIHDEWIVEQIKRPLQ